MDQQEPMAYLRRAITAIDQQLYEIFQRQEGKLSKFRGHVIALGEVGETLSTSWLNWMREIGVFEDLQLHHRYAREIKDGEVFDPPLEQTRAGLKARGIRDLLRDTHSDISERFDFNPYSTLEELRENMEEPIHGVARVAVWAPRLEQAFFKGIDSDGNPILYNPNDSNDGKLLERVLQSTIFGFSGDVDGTYTDVLRQIDTLTRIAREMEKPYKKGGFNFRKGRSKGLVSNIIGAINFAKQMEGYQGNVIVVTNEIDINSYLISAIAGIDGRMVLGICENDRMRIALKILEQLGEDGHGREVVIPVVGTHNHLMTPLIKLGYLLSKDRKGEIEIPLSKYFGDLEFARQDSANFGLSTYQILGTSKHDTVAGIMEVLRALVHEDRDVRVSSYNPKKDIFIGSTASFSHRMAFPHQREFQRSSYTDAEWSRKQFAVESQQYLIARLREEGFLDNQRPRNDLEIPLSDKELTQHLRRRLEALERTGVSDADLKPQVRKLLQEVREQERIEVQSLETKLDSTLYVKSSSHNKRFTSYSLGDGSETDFEINLRSKLGVAEAYQEHDRTTLFKFFVDRNGVHALSQRRKGDKSIEYRQISYTNEGTITSVSEPFKFGMGRVKDATRIGNILYVAAELNNTSILYSVEGDEVEEITTLPDGTDSLTSNQSELIIGAKDGVYTWESKLHKMAKAKSPYNIKATDDLIMFITDNEELTIRDTKSKKAKRFSTANSCYDLIEQDGQYFLATLDENGIFVQQFSSKNALVKGKSSSSYTIETNGVKILEDLHFQDPSTIIAMNTHNVHAYSRNSHLTLDISNFSSLDSLVVRNADS